MWDLATFKIAASLSFLKWNDFLSFGLPTLIQKYEKKKKKKKKIISRETDSNFTGCQMPHFMTVLVMFIYLLNLSWKKKSIIEEYGAFT